jgi:hypothetical protein
VRAAAAKSTRRGQQTQLRAAGLGGRAPHFPKPKETAQERAGRPQKLPTSGRHQTYRAPKPTSPRTPNTKATKTRKHDRVTASAAQKSWQTQGYRSKPQAEAKDDTDSADEKPKPVSRETKSKSTTQSSRKEAKNSNKRSRQEYEEVDEDDDDPAYAGSATEDDSDEGESDDDDSDDDDKPRARRTHESECREDEDKEYQPNWATFDKFSNPHGADAKYFNRRKLSTYQSYPYFSFLDNLPSRNTGFGCNYTFVLVFVGVNKRIKENFDLDSLAPTAAKQVGNFENFWFTNSYDVYTCAHVPYHNITI